MVSNTTSCLLAVECRTRNIIIIMVLRMWQNRSIQVPLMFWLAQLYTLCVLGSTLITPVDSACICTCILEYVCTLFLSNKNIAHTLYTPSPQSIPEICFLALQSLQNRECKNAKFQSVLSVCCFVFSLFCVAYIAIVHP